MWRSEGINSTADRKCKWDISVWLKAILEEGSAGVSLHLREEQRVQREKKRERDSRGGNIERSQPAMNSTSLVKHSKQSQCETSAVQPDRQPKRPDVAPVLPSSPWPPKIHDPQNLTPAPSKQTSLSGLGFKPGPVPVDDLWMQLPQLLCGL